MDQLLSLLKEFDIANFLPKAETFVDQLRLDLALLVLICPLLLLALGAWYYFLPREKVDDPLGFRGLRKVRSKQAWQYSQRIAGMGYGILGIAMVVVFGILCLFFGAMSPTSAATCAFVCVIIELILTLIVWVGIQVLTWNRSGKSR